MRGRLAAQPYVLYPCNKLFARETPVSPCLRLTVFELFYTSSLLFCYTAIASVLCVEADREALEEPMHEDPSLEHTHT